MRVGTGYFLAAAVFVLAAGLFTLDLLTPARVRVEAAYAVVVLISLYFPRHRETYLTAVVCTVLTLLALPFSPPGIPVWMGLANRAVAAILIWATAFLGLAARRTAQLVEANLRLQQEVRERQRAEDRIREQAALLDQVPDAILIRDMDDRICYWNRGAERLYGWSVAEALGRDADELLYRDPGQLQEAQIEVFRGGAWTGETRQVTKDGRDIIAETRWVLLSDKEGQPRAKLVINTDVTVRKRLEAQLLRAQRLESLGTLAGGVAHDFNNLLTPILMAVKLLKENPPLAKRQRLLTTVQAGAERGAAIVTQLLAVAGDSSHKAEAVILKDLIGEVANILDHPLPKSVGMRVEVADDLWPVRGDPTQLSQVLMNLCINARDAMPEGGTLTISAANRSLGPEAISSIPGAAPGPHVILSVADSGTGIPPEVLDKIFDPFFTTKPPGKGTGLGLFTALGIIRGHGGFIDVSSEVGKGTLFTIHLPASPAGSRQPGPERRAGPPAGHGELILVVDDEPAIRETARETLEGHGYQVVTAGNGREALERYKEHQGAVRAVLLDLMMPVMGGPATIEGLRRLAPLVPIVATSGLRSAGPGAEGVAAGPDVFLQKPFGDEELLATIARVLGEACPVSKQP